MPYIVLKRTDIPDSVLQATLDLWPNTSLKNSVNPPGLGQTGYQKNIDLDTTTLSGTSTFDTEAAGLTAWLLTSVSSGSGVRATGAITTIAKALFTDGENLVISDGTSIKTFIFVVTAGYAVAAPQVMIDLSGAGVITAANVRDVIITAINAVPDFNVTASNGGAATVTLTNVDENISAASRNVVITTTAAGLGFAVAGMAGATNSTALSVLEAQADSTAILTLFGYGDVTVAAGALTLAAINGAMVTGAITEAQVEEILQVLAGRTFTVPAGTDIETAGAFTNPTTTSFWTTSWKNIRYTEQLRISLGEGRLRLATRDTFSYGGVLGAAVIVYDEDGNLYTVPV